MWVLLLKFFQLFYMLEKFYTKVQEGVAGGHHHKRLKP